jgi:hypothetical protein
VIAIPGKKAGGGLTTNTDGVNDGTRAVLQVFTVLVLTQVVLAATSGAAITFCIMTGSLLIVVDSTFVTATSDANAGTTAATAATIAALNANAFFIDVISPMTKFKCLGLETAAR